MQCFVSQIDDLFSQFKNFVNLEAVCMLLLPPEF